MKRILLDYNQVLQLANMKSPGIGLPSAGAADRLNTMTKTRDDFAAALNQMGPASQVALVIYSPDEDEDAA